MYFPIREKATEKLNLLKFRIKKTCYYEKKCLKTIYGLSKILEDDNLLFKHYLSKLRFDEYKFYSLRSGVPEWEKNDLTDKVFMDASGFRGKRHCVLFLNYVNNSEEFYKTILEQLYEV